MISKIPIIGSPVGCRQIIYALARLGDNSVKREFKDAIAGFIEKKQIYFINSGIAAFYIILIALKEKSKKTEVILPAYTAGSLVTAVLKAGLKPVLCDITLKDFNPDIDSLCEAVSCDTLAVVCVHMFGIGIHEIVKLRQKLPRDVFLIEDCAQSMGSKIDSRQSGGFGDISFFSFNRGKNLPAYKGGCIATNIDEIAGSIERQTQEIQEKGVVFKFLIPIETLAISLAVKPFIYGLCYHLIAQFKENAPPKNITLGKFTNFQAGLGVSLLNTMPELFEKRYRNGIFLIEQLKDCPELIVAQIAVNSQPAFNRLPILFKDLNKREKAEKRLLQSGIETSRMYLKPLHYIFDLGYKKEDFPNACYLAAHLLTLPVHPLVREEDLQRMINIIRETVE